MKKYRIVFNTLTYRVQWLGKTFFLKQPKWYWLRQYTYAGDYVAEFSSKEEAHKAIIQAKIEDFARKQGYIPIKEHENENTETCS